MVKLSIIICTYNREKSVKNNIDILNKSCRKFVKHVYVIDNGSNLPSSYKNDFISIIYNKNLGGSGGYARGMYEVKKDPETTHIMLMDDDITFEPDVIKNAVIKLNSIGKDDWLSFGMRTFDNPNKIYENTAYWNGIRIKSNFRGIDINSNHLTKKIKNNYAGWWALIMPISVISKYGYPMPYFIKSDDIEYGLRRLNEKIFYDNNISILHESFEKKYSTYLNYYNVRNHMITDIIHFKHSLIKCLSVFILRSSKAWLTGKYKIIILYFLAMKDFLRGDEFLSEIKLDDYNKYLIDFTNNIKFSFLKFLFAPIIAIYYSFLLMFKHKHLRLNYKKKFNYFTSIEYWSKQFE